MDKRTNGKEIAMSFINACILNGISISEAYLFGSCVNGKQNIWSDIDVALVANSFNRNIIENTLQTALINYQFPDVEVHHFSTDDFSLSDPFINEIKRTGIKIY
jgi:predicted nucleotidyltransferase